MRVLHVIDAGRPLIREFARALPREGLDDRILACKLIKETSGKGHEHRVCIVGTRAAAARAASLGLNAESVVSPLLGLPQTAPGPVGQLIKSIRPDIVHWWNGEWSGGCFGRPGRAWRLESVLGSTPLRLPVWLSSGGAITCGPAEASRAAQAGLRAFSTEPPAFAGATSTRDKRDGSSTVLLLGPDGDARQFFSLYGLTSCLGLAVHGVLLNAGGSLARTRRYMRNAQFDIQMTSFLGARAAVLPLCDFAIWMGSGVSLGPSGIAIRSSLASGVPVIVSPEAEWVIPEPLREPLVALNSTIGELTRKLVALIERPSPLDPRPFVHAAAANRSFVHAVLTAYSGRSETARAATADPRPAISAA